MVEGSGLEAITVSGQKFLVELAQFVYLLRLMMLVVIVFAGTSTLSAGGTIAAVAIGVLSVVCALALHDLLRTVAEHPLIAVADVVLTVASVWASGSSEPFVLLGATSALLLGLLQPIRAAAMLCALLFSAVTLVTTVQADGNEPDVQIWQLAVLYAAAAAAAAIVRERLLRLAREAFGSGESFSQSEERARMAREMHDGVVKSLHGIALSAHGLSQDASAPPELRAKFRRFAAAADTGVRQARAALVELRVDSDDRAFNVVLTDLAQRWGERLQISTVVSTADGVDIADPIVRSACMACVREALDNIAQHAGASQIEVTLSLGTEGSLIRIRDNGRGFDQGRLLRAFHGGHYGVRGMSERMDRAGGSARVDSASGTGTTVELFVPRSATTVWANQDSREWSHHDR